MNWITCQNQLIKWKSWKPSRSASNKRRKKPELKEIKLNGNDVYTCKYLQDEGESVTIGEELPTVERAAPAAQAAVNKPVAPKRGSSKLTSTTVTATVEKTEAETEGSEEAKESNEEVTEDNPE